jgi:hypothetical protein
MSTQINVTVGSGGLPEKAKQQQQAARQAQLEKERQRRIEAQGQEQRNAALTAEGRAPDGSVLSSGKAKQPLAQPRPAAFRSDNLPNVGTMWDFYSYGGPAVTLGNLGWRARNITTISANVEYFPTNNLTTQTNNNTIACGSGKEHQTITTERTELIQIFSTGTKTPSVVIDSYSYSPPPNPYYYVSYKAYFFNLVAVGGVVNNLYQDSAILPAGKDNAIYIYFTRRIASLRKYNMGAYYVDYFTSAGNYDFTNPSTPTQIDGGPTTLLGAPIDGVFTYNNSSGELATATVPKLFSGFNIDLSYSDSFRAFAVNKNKIREIVFPEYLKNKITSKWPLQYQQVNDNLYSDIQYTATDYNYGMSLNGDWFSARYDDITGFGKLIAVTDYGEISTATPEIFSKINTDIQFTDPANIKQFDFSKYRVILEDRSSGMFSAYANGTCSNDFSFQDYSLSDITVKDLYATAEYIDFAVWKNPGESVDYSVFNTSGCPITPSLPQVIKNRKARTQMFPGRPAAPAFPTYGDATLIAITDGGDPGYCRSMCLALGFTEADLTP